MSDIDEIFDLCPSCELKTWRAAVKAKHGQIHLDLSKMIVGMLRRVGAEG